MRPRSRVFYGLLLVATIALGLLSRSGAAWLPRVVVEHAGDMLWSVALYWTLCLLAPRASALLLASITFLISALVECSQSIQAPWLDDVRQHQLGRLLIGTTFVWSDFPRYLLGTIAAAVIDIGLLRRCHSSHPRAEARTPVEIGD